MSKFNPALPHSDVRGVSFAEPIGRWQVRLRLAGVDTYLGSYDTQAEAEKIALRARRGEPVQKRGRPSKSGVRGVTWNKQARKWHVRVRRDGRLRSFGLYTDLGVAEQVAIDAHNGLLEPGTNARFHGTRTGRPRRPPADPDTTPAPTTPAVTPEPARGMCGPMRVRPVVVPWDQQPTPDPPLPPVDPYRHLRKQPLTQQQIDRLRELARGPRRTV